MQWTQKESRSFWTYVKELLTEETGSCPYLDLLGEFLKMMLCVKNIIQSQIIWRYWSQVFDKSTYLAKNTSLPELCITEHPSSFLLVVDEKVCNLTSLSGNCLLIPSSELNPLLQGGKLDLMSYIYKDAKQSRYLMHILHNVGLRWI